jgi:chemotaxis protein methyltransferase CheR
MKTTLRGGEHLVALLSNLACRVTGFQPDSFHIGAIERIIREKTGEGLSPEELARQALQGEPEILASLYEAVPVGETYFFRQPGHYHYLETEVLPGYHGRSLKVWSAGCATGEETYSLAGCLASSGLPIDVLGTDLSAKHLEKAQEGAYSAWSLRGAKEILYPIFQEPVQPPYRIKSQVRVVTRFYQHNFLEPLPQGEGPFDILFCRNALIYFTPAAARQAAKNFWKALAPGGLLFLGPTDAFFPLAGFESQGPPKLSVYRKSQGPKKRNPEGPLKKRARKQPDVSPNSLSSEPRTAVLREAKEKSDPVLLHLRALEAMENESHRETEHQLKQLHRKFPDYLPGLYENAMWNARNKRVAAARGFMEELFNRLKARDFQEVVRGPRDLTVDFYLASALSFLKRDAP